jgi:hypothetical protein
LYKNQSIQPVKSVDKKQNPANIGAGADYINEPARRVPVVAAPDVLVVGGGPAGAGAALAAARNGASVLLVERYGFLGGNLTAAMINPIFTFHDINGGQIIRGIAGEIVERLVHAGASPGHVADLTFDNASMTPFDPEGMKLLLADMMREAGVELMLHTRFSDVIDITRRPVLGRAVSPGPPGITGDERGGLGETALPKKPLPRNIGGIIDGARRAGPDLASGRELSCGPGRAQEAPAAITHVIVENKSGRLAIRPKIIIDCTGDGDVAARAGAGFAKGRDSDGAMQPVSLFYRIGGVDYAALRAWMKQNRALLKDSPTDAEIDGSRVLAFLGLSELVRRAVAAGDYPPDGAPRILLYQLPRPGQIVVNCTRLQGIDGAAGADMTRAELATRRQAWQIWRFLQKHVGGFENTCILDTAAQVGVRETRRIFGDYTMTGDDVLNSRAFPDGVATGAFAIDIHPPDGLQQIFTGSGRAVYEIPYRSLCPRGIDNLLVAGRCISVTHNAHGSIRVMATAIATGQGAGAAAALAARAGAGTRQVDIKELRALLLAQGQYLLNAALPEITDPALRLHRANGTGAQAGHYNPFEK